MEPPLELPPSTDPAPPAPPSVAEVIAPPASLPMTCGCTNAARGRDASVVLQLQHPTADGGATASTPVLSKIHATKTKKAGAAQPPCSPAPMQSPAAQSGPASAGTAAGHGAMDGAQQLVEESPTKFVRLIVTSFSVVELLV